MKMSERRGKKMNKKKIVVISLTVSVIAILSLGSLAWFTAEDSVTNKFMIAESTEDPDKTFGIDVWETVDQDRDGQTEEVGKGTKDNNAQFEQVLPGEVITKEPVITNTGVHPMYVRAIVTVSDADYLVSHILDGDYSYNWWDTDRLLPGTPDTWKLDQILLQNDELILIYYYQAELAAGATTDEIFQDVVIPTEMTVEDAMAMQDFSVSVFGHAIQSENLADVTNAKEAFEKYWDNAEGTTKTPVADDNSADVNRTTTVTIDEVAQYITVNPTIDGTTTEAAIKVAEGVDNGTFIIHGGNFNNGAKIVVAPDGANTICVYITDTIYIDGVKATIDQIKDLCENITFCTYAM